MVRPWGWKQRDTYWYHELHPAIREKGAIRSNRQLRRNPGHAKEGKNRGS